MAEPETGRAHGYPSMTVLHNCGGTLGVRNVHVCTWWVLVQLEACMHGKVSYGYDTGT